MKILQIGKFYPIWGGVEKVMYDIMQGLSCKNVSCDMLCAAAEGQTPGVIQVNEYARVLCMPAWIKLFATMISPAMIIHLRKIRQEYDIIHIHHPDPMACLALWLSGYKGKVILHWHSDILKQKTLLKLYRPLQQWLINRADVIVGTTLVYVQQSPFLQGVQEKITYIPIGADRPLVDPDATARIIEKYAGKKIVFSLGRLVEYKGYEYLVDAARYLDDSYIILIGGGGPLKAELQQRINKQELGEKVKLIGYIPEKELGAYFTACDIFCLSSIWKTEAFGIVQIEAMSCGKPIVATCIKESGVSWVNADGVSGYNVEPENPEALAEAIRNILSDRQRYKEFSARALERYETMFTLEKMADRCLKLYNDLLGKAALPLPNESFFQTVKSLLDEGKQVRIPVKGSGMRPFLQDGDTVTLIPASDGAVRWGTVVLARTTAGNIVLHRVIFRKKNRLWLMGDAHSRQREQTTGENVLAIAEADSFGRRCIVVLWFLLLPFRGVLLRIHNRFNQKK